MTKGFTYSLKRFIGIGFAALIKSQGKRFYCNALRGESTDNISVNSDLSVSCNCHDVYGLGKLGYLREQSLMELLTGEKARYLRRTLAQGKLPMVDCVRCSDLRWIDKNRVAEYTDNSKPPLGMMIENTVNCNLSCVSCRREILYGNRRKRSLSLEDIEYISDCMKTDGIKNILYFNHGEPFLSKTIRQEIEILREKNPEAFICVSTNGLLLDRSEKAEAALNFDHIFFSIFGSTHESLCQYQSGGDFTRAYGNMKSLVALRNSRNRVKPIIEWKYVLFRWNDSPKLIDRAIQLAKAAKVDILSFWPTLSPLSGISYKYYLGFKYLRTVGKPSWKGREIDFRKKAIQC
jgi:uncharacterized Fe-S cluster-containing radical SAM superfamily protein